MKFDSYLKQTSESTVAIHICKETDNLLVVGFCCPDLSDWKQGNLNESLIRTDIFFLAPGRAMFTYLFSMQKCSNSSALEAASNETQVRSNTPLIRFLSLSFSLSLSLSLSLFLSLPLLTTKKCLEEIQQVFTIENIWEVTFHRKKAWKTGNREATQLRLKSQQLISFWTQWINWWPAGSPRKRLSCSNDSTGGPISWVKLILFFMNKIMKQQGGFVTPFVRLNRTTNFLLDCHSKKT